MKTAVVILNWNTKGYLEKFLPPLLSSMPEDAEVIFADSASTDGSMEMMAAKFPSVRRIVLDKNYGFTGGYNRALAQIEAEYFVLINSDIEVGEGWLEPLIKTLDDNPEVGACGPKLLSYYDRDQFEYAGAAGGYIDKYGYPFCRGRVMKLVEKDRGQYDEPADVFWVTGACLMVRRSLYKSLGGLDDRFFAHQEEIDFCWRLQLAGYRVRVVPQSVVWHLGGGTLPNDSPWKLKLNFRNNLLMLENNLAFTFAQEDSVGKEAKISAEKVSNDYPFGTQTENSIAKKALGKAGRRIAMRMIMDGCSAIVYLATFKLEYFNAVLTAHKEYRQMRRRWAAGDVVALVKAKRGASVKGIYPHWIVLKAILLKSRVFEEVAKFSLLMSEKRENEGI